MEVKDQNNKENIADSFEKHFKHFGYKKTSVDEVAKELKMSKKTIYRFFSSKERIYYFLVSRVAKKYAGSMGKKISRYNSSEEKIINLVNLIFEETRKWLKQGNDAFEFKFKYEIAELAFKEAYNKLFIKILSEGMESGEFQKQDINLTIGIINGIFSETMKYFNENPDSDYTTVSDSIIKILK